MAEEKAQQGTGKHPHKSAADPTPHHEAASTKEKDAHSSSSHSSGSHTESKATASHRSESSNGSDDSSDLKSREYTDKDGNIHHHTRAKAE